MILELPLQALLSLIIIITVYSAASGSPLNAASMCPVRLRHVMTQQIS